MVICNNLALFELLLASLRIAAFKVYYRLALTQYATGKIEPLLVVQSSGSILPAL